jgi:hypothetical protein
MARDRASETYPAAATSVTAPPPAASSAAGAAADVEDRNTFFNPVPSAEPARKKQSVGDTEGDRHKNWPADPKAYYLYFPDDGTYLKEALGDSEGFWLRGGERAEIVVRALEPVRRMTIRVTGGPAGDEVGLRLGRSTKRVGVGAGATRSAVLEPSSPMLYKDTFVYVLALTSRRGADGIGPDGRSRHLGAFVSIALDVIPRPRPKP